MSKRLYILLFSFLTLSLFSQSILRSFPRAAITAQFAGSTGLFTLGFSKVSTHNKAEIGLLYGRVPQRYGGINNSLVLKFTYNPFFIELHKKLKLEPVQAGLFLNQNFSRRLSPTRGDQYPKGYYWWTKSLRFHLFLSTQLAYRIETKHIDRLACYFETNTNDLYLTSYFSNLSSLSLYDIFFFGTGLKIYIQ